MIIKKRKEKKEQLKTCYWTSTCCLETVLKTTFYLLTKTCFLVA